MRLRDKVILITGGGSGMGRLASLTFAREGARVVSVDVVPEAGAAAVDEITRAGGQALFVAADVGREDQVRNAVRQAVARFGRLDVLYNNAGIFPAEDGSVVELDAAVWDRVMTVNLKGIYLCCKHGIPELLRAGGGSIINVASFVALVGCSVPQDAYTASKGGVIALTKSLAVQFGPQRIRTNAIAPGPVETPLLTSWLLANPEAKKRRLDRIPMGRFGRPEDIVQMALYLASDEATWVNGSVLVVDGGITSNYF
ncbi:MAG: glucose 1-dehydrogenase [Bacillati bacterium ANGP1]|uniref:Glucose 1-dehydrogenase n=1 Tax=Candidatus Segetimicrobium genomatis TaxID=2569760 RepID=A0A537LIG3_9BACT|nr:MAG: glucose 1-dehydrogenase [Terrabacteria group bacterium ANGP1]